LLFAWGCSSLSRPHLLLFLLQFLLLLCWLWRLLLLCWLLLLLLLVVLLLLLKPPCCLC
jgi:hypothetical protein